MVIRYCIRSNFNSKKNAEKLKNKLISITPKGTLIDIMQDNQYRQSANQLFKYLSQIMNDEFYFLVLLDDSVIVNKNIHNNLLQSNDIRATNNGIIHISMPTSATLFSSDTKYDPDEKVFFRTDVVYDSRGIVLSKKILKKMNLNELSRKNIFSISHFITKNLKNYKMNNTIHYPSLVATTKENVFLDEYDYEILDDFFSESWDITNKDMEYRRFVFTAKNCGLHDKIDFLDDFSDDIIIDTQSNEKPSIFIDNLAMGKRNENKKTYFLDLGSTYTWSVFVEYLSAITKLEIIRNIENATTLMAQGHSVFTNGFHVRFMDIARKHPMKLNCFWHSSFSGVDIMQERDLFIKFIEAINEGFIRGFFLNQSEVLAPGAKRFWLPFLVEPETQMNHDTICDFAIVATSPYSVNCKNVLATIICLLSNNYSFIIPKWLAVEYKVESLKLFYASTSRIIEFDTTEIPIELSYYKSARFYLTTSHTDTMPYSCVESINSGTPFIITKSIGWASYFQNEDFVLDDISQLPRFYNKYINNNEARTSIYDKQKNELSRLSIINKRMLTKLFNNYN